jgi:peptidoglycan/LPS O-acetylase OafA/YrhL
MTATVDTASPAGRIKLPGPKPSKTRYDVQGIRAFAVLAVIVDHLTGWPGGGFVGVDVFFVISGFLITGLLLREHERTDNISFTAFYRRRFKRIIPASVLVILTTVVAANAIFSSTRFEPLKTDAWWALFFSANWRFGTEHVDYFNADRAISPLQHYWSLGVEEQFYFVWPWLMLAVFALLVRGSRSRNTARVVVGAVMAVITAGSFAWAILQTGSDATLAYFSTFTRVWELGVGALLAVAVPLLARIPDAVRPVMSWAGLSGMVAALWLVDGSKGFPAPAAALPVVATGLVIAAGTFGDFRQQQRFLWPLTNRASNYIGDVSYSLYLWHFPIIVLGEALIGDTALDQVVLGLVIAVVSVYSYHLVEDPIRRSQWLEPDRKRREPTFAVAYSYRYLAFSALILVTLSLVAVAIQPTDEPESALQRAGTTSTPTASPGAPEAVPATVGPMQDNLTTQIRTALEATRWPADLDPSMDEAMASQQAPDDVMPCGTKAVVEANCTWGGADAKRTVMIVGDSIGVTYVEAFRTALKDYPNWRVKAYTSFGCPFMSVDTKNSDTQTESVCPDRREAALAAIQRVKPDLLVVANTYTPLTPVDQDAAMSADGASIATIGLVQQVADSASKVLLLAAPPYEKSPEECYTRTSSPADCANTIVDDWQAHADADRSQIDIIPNGVFIDSSPWFCTLDLCPAFVERTPVHEDAFHMTQWYAAKIGPVIFEYLQANGLLDQL